MHSEKRWGSGTDSDSSNAQAFGLAGRGTSSTDIQPRLDIFEDDDGVTVVAEIPGVHRDDIDITLDAATLTISGRKEPRDSQQRRKQLVNELSFGGFRRSVALHAAVDEDRIRAFLQEGVLTVHLPWAAPGEQHRRIPVESV